MVSNKNRRWHQSAKTLENRFEMVRTSTKQSTWLLLELASCFLLQRLRIRDIKKMTNVYTINVCGMDSWNVIEGNKSWCL